MSNAHFGPRFSIPDEETGKVFPLPEIPWEKIVGRWRRSRSKLDPSTLALRPQDYQPAGNPGAT